MKMMHILIVALATSVISLTGYAAGSEPEEKAAPSSAMNEGDGSGVRGGMHHEGMTPYGMMRHHMMHSGPSPVTVLVYPGVMPMMGHGMMHHKGKGDHGRSEMHQEKMKHRHDRRQERMEHMQSVEERLANIEKLLGQLLEEMQKND